MNRPLVCAVLGVALLPSVVACTARGGRPAAAASWGAASPRASAPGRAQVVDASRTNLTTSLSTADLPGPTGMYTAAVGRAAATFVWETAAGGFCFGLAATSGGFISTSCVHDPRDVPFSARPALIPLVSTYSFAEVHVIGADRETVRSVTCNGEPLTFRRLPPFMNGRRELYAFDLTEPTAGRVTVTVVRGRATATEHVALMGGSLKHRASCR
ncbi:hypothetical protein ACIQU5_30445 [Streptomyces sp. NPDC090306]|uniref:hypothetical protein n=1 Tax=Streptomyces sp. NPDC090306 TaxID=3365961 RepID=UPI0038048D3A